MKKLFALTFLLTFLFVISCDSNSTGNDSSLGEVNTYTTANVKTAGRQYYSFSTNEASGTVSDNYNLIFTLTTRSEEVGAAGSGEFYEVGSDPIAFTSTANMTARVNAATLEDVSDIPESTEFTTDDTTATAIIEGSWLDNSFNVLPDVYVIKDYQGNYGLLAFKEYVYNPAVHQIQSIKWQFKYLNDGSMDFSSTAVDSFTAGNAYDAPVYWSFVDGSLSFGYGSWQIKLVGSDVWLGPGTVVKKLENTKIDDVTTVTADGFSGDDLPNIATAGWYDSDEAHKVIPKDYVYVIKIGEKYAAYEISNYYDSQGNSGAFTIRWRYLN